MELGTLASMWRYPVKSLAGESLEAHWVDVDGLEGDRSRALIVRGGHARMGKPLRGKELDTLHRIHDVETAQRAAKEHGIATQPMASQDRYFDDAPVSLIIDRWLDGLSAHVGYPVEIERFRPNFAIRASHMPTNEGALTGRELRLGEVTLRVRYPIERCVVTTYDPHGDDADARILRYVAAARGSWMGIYCDVLCAGTVRIGDSLVLVER